MHIALVEGALPDTHVENESLSLPPELKSNSIFIRESSLDCNLLWLVKNLSIVNEDFISPCIYGIALGTLDPISNAM